MPIAVDQIVENSKVEPGVDYEKSAFNGFEAAYGQYVNEEEGVWDYYQIPYGNRLINIGYHSSVLAADEKVLAEEMLKSMRFSIVEKEIKKSYIEECNSN